MILCLQPYPVQSLVVCAADVLVMPDSFGVLASLRSAVRLRDRSDGRPGTRQERRWAVWSQPNQSMQQMTLRVTADRPKTLAGRRLSVRGRCG